MSQRPIDASRDRVIFSYGTLFIITWALLATYLFSDVGVSFTSFFIAIVFTVIWSALWTVRLIPQFKKFKIFQRVYSSSIVIWRLEPVAFILIAALAYSDALMCARLYASSAALEGYVNDVRSGRIVMSFEFENGHPARSVGLYSIYLTEKIPNEGVQFLTSRDGLFDRAGFAYYSSGEPPHRGKNSYTHIYGPWWKWKEWF